MLHKIVILFTCCLFLLGVTSQLKGQTFGAKVIAGLNAAQINGDMLHGYHKPGIVLGLGSNFLVSERMDVDIELLYSQRGSQRGFFGSSDLSGQRKIGLQYLSIPVLLSYHDWLSDDDEYYKMRFSGGFSFGRLFAASFVDEQFNEFQQYENRLNQNDFSFLLGATFRWNEKMGVHVRYNHSINRLYNATPDQPVNLQGLRSFFWSIRLEYSLL